MCLPNFGYEWVSTKQYADEPSFILKIVRHTGKQSLNTKHLIQFSLIQTNVHDNVPFQRSKIVHISMVPDTKN